MICSSIIKHNIHITYIYIYMYSIHNSLLALIILLDLTKTQDATARPKGSNLRANAWHRGKTLHKSYHAFLVLRWYFLYMYVTRVYNILCIYVNIYIGICLLFTCVCVLYIYCLFKSASERTWCCSKQVCTDDNTWCCFVTWYKHLSASHIGSLAVQATLVWSSFSSDAVLFFWITSSTKRIIPQYQRGKKNPSLRSEPKPNDWNPQHPFFSVEKRFVGFLFQDDFSASSCQFPILPKKQEVEF